MKINEKATTNLSIDHSVFFNITKRDFAIIFRTKVRNYDFATNIYGTHFDNIFEFDKLLNMISSKYKITFCLTLHRINTR